jgi:hypothetical protein
VKQRGEVRRGVASPQKARTRDHAKTICRGDPRRIAPMPTSKINHHTSFSTTMARGGSAMSPVSVVARRSSHPRASIRGATARLTVWALALAAFGATAVATAAAPANSRAAVAADAPGAGAREVRAETHGFGATVCITPDPNWKTKWSGPAGSVPPVERVESLRIGETVWALIFVTNPLPDSTGQVDVTCDLRMVRPNGKVSEHRGLRALRKKVDRSARFTHLSEFVLTMKGEETDPVGEWVIEIVVRDKNRGVEVPLVGRYTLLPKKASTAAPGRPGSGG